MNEQQLVEQKKALDESIEHWTRLATGTRNTGEGIFGDDCALCKVYHNTDKYSGVEDLRCVGCPIAIKTGRSFCEAGPWHYVHDVKARLTICNARYGIYETDEFKAAAQVMLDFLISLRNEYHPIK